MRPADKAAAAAAAERTAATLAKRESDAEALAVEQGHVIALVDGLLAHPETLAWQPDGATGYRLVTPVGAVQVIRDVDHKGRTRYSVTVMETGGAGTHTLRGSEDGDDTVAITTQLRTLWEQARGSGATVAQVAGDILAHVQSTAAPSAAPTIPTE